jgi:phosphate acetyltransferase
MDVPAYAETLFVTDAAINIFPDLDAKRDIIQNAIDFYTQAGFGKFPRVAILSAVETVTSKIPSTIEAAALCKMADRGQITGGVLDGPLAFDNAIDVEAARIKGIKSEVAGRAQILLVPDLESGNMLAKNLAYLAKADSAGIVLGARVPIVLTSRADSPRARMASCAVAVLYADARRKALAAATCRLRSDRSSLVSWSSSLVECSSSLVVSSSSLVDCSSSLVVSSSSTVDCSSSFVVSSSSTVDCSSSYEVSSCRFA